MRWDRCAIPTALVLPVLSCLAISDSLAAPAETAAPQQAEAGPAVPPQPRGVALVIANGSLGDKTLLPAASVRVCLLANTLERLRLEVAEVHDPDRAALLRAITTFGRKAKTADIAVAYYVGLTVSYRGANRLVPTDAGLKTPKTMRRSTVPLASLRNALLAARRFGVLVLDGGYRQARLERLERRRRSRVAKGLARPSKRNGVAMLLADRPGQWRTPGRADDMGLAQALARGLSRPAPDIAIRLAALASDVRKATGEKQKPLLVSGLKPSSTWPFESKNDVRKGGLIFRWESEKRADGEERALRRCRKLAEIRLARRNAARACKRVLAKRSLADYRKLLGDFPRAPCKAEVTRRRDGILEVRRWKKIAKSARAEDFEAYLERFPEGAHKGKAKHRLTALIAKATRREREAFLKAKAWLPESARIKVLKRFLASYPKGEHAGEVRELITRLERARSSGRIEPLRAFIREHPKSPYAERVRRRIADLIAEKERANRARAEAQKADTVEAYRKFLRLYPSSEHAKEARKRLVDLEREEEERRAKATCQGRHGEDFANLLHDDDKGYLCILKGKRVRAIPVAADKVGAWHFVKHKSGLCEIWTYPVSISGTLNSNLEPKIAFSHSENSSAGSLGFGVTWADIWDQSEDISIEIDGTTYRLQFSGAWVKPRKTGATSVSDNVTMALRKAGSFTVRGTSAQGGPLELSFSARGFEVQFRDMARKCGRSILTWIEKWGAVARKGNGQRLEWGSGYNSEAKAREGLLDYCRHGLGEGRCRIIATFENSCFALYRAMSGGWSLSTANTTADARAKAKANCEAGHEGCYLSATECSDGSNGYKNEAPPHPSMTWRLKSNTSYSVMVEFYSQNRRAAWPGGRKAYVIKDWDVHDYSLTCRWGEQICYGAWPKGQPRSGYWGCGYGCRQGCSNCCYTCKGQTTGVKKLNP